MSPKVNGLHEMRYLISPVHSKQPAIVTQIFLMCVCVCVCVLWQEFETCEHGGLWELKGCVDSLQTRKLEKDSPSSLLLTQEIECEPPEKQHSPLKVLLGGMGVVAQAANTRQEIWVGNS